MDLMDINGVRLEVQRLAPRTESGRAPIVFLHEGLGSVLIDALEAGLPVVATAVGGIPEIIRDGENGMLFQPDDAAAFEAAVAGFEGDPALRARVAAANRLRAREFSAATMTGRYARLYRDVAARQNVALTLP